MRAKLNAESRPSLHCNLFPLSHLVRTGRKAMKDCQEPQELAARLRRCRELAQHFRTGPTPR